MGAYSHADANAPGGDEPGKVLADRKGKFANSSRMISRWFRNARDHHITIADGLDLLQTELLEPAIKDRKNVI